MYEQSPTYLRKIGIKNLKRVLRADLHDFAEAVRRRGRDVTIGILVAAAQDGVTMRNPNLDDRDILRALTDAVCTVAFELSLPEPEE